MKQRYRMPWRAAIGVACLAAGAFGQDLRREWVNIFDGDLFGGEAGYAIGVDGEGGIFVTGTGTGKTSHVDFVTIRYSQDGRREWVRYYDGPGNGEEYVHDAAVDPRGGFVITGRSEGAKTGYDFGTVRYDGNGRQVWVARYNGPAGRDDIPERLVIDAQSNVYVTGRSEGKKTADDFVTVKYDASGREVWAVRHDDGGRKLDAAKDVAVDADGNVFVTGVTLAGRATFDLDIVTLKYDRDGRLQWRSVHNGPTDDVDDPAAIAVDDGGDVYVTGQTRIGHEHIVTIKVEGDSGRELWTARYGGLGTGINRPNSIGFDDLDNVYISGASTGTNGYLDAVTIKYDADTGLPSETWRDLGDGVGVRRYDSPEEQIDEAYAMFVDGTGTVYIVGGSRYSIVGDAFIVRYDAHGDLTWSDVYSRSNDHEYSSAITMDGRGNVYTTGMSWGDLADLTTVKYAPVGK